MEIIKNIRMVAVGICLSNGIHSFILGMPWVGAINFAVVVLNLLPDFLSRKKYQTGVQNPES
jgi:hypothetical protein